MVPRVAVVKSLRVKFSTGAFMAARERRGTGAVGGGGVGVAAAEGR